MLNTGKLSGLTLFITGGSRGIGKAIALKAARDGANIVIAAKTAEPHPKLPGTIYTAAKEIEEAGGKCLPCVVDVRDESQISDAVNKSISKFGGIDIVVNNASAISLTPTLDTEMKRYDLMHNINTRGTFLVSKMCIPHLRKSKHAHILNISPPLNMNPNWFRDHVAYTMAKYGMSMCVLGMAAELKSDNIAVNALWPRTAIYTAAVEMLSGSTEAKKLSRNPEIMADAAYAVLSRSVQNCTGQFLVDDEVLRQEGITDFDQYASDPTYKGDLMMDFFLDESPHDGFNQGKEKSQKAKKLDGKDNIEGIFTKINSHLTPEIAKGTNACFLFVVKGDEDRTYYVDLTGNGAAGKGKPTTKPDATLTMEADKIEELFDGKLKAGDAYMSGKLKISGSLMKAMKLEKLMKLLKAKY
ncbi:hydroxysteroid dehydrogenase-like protein 2 [Metopolophium dirhodum]|uniref:hydroxysteroid dehydrogenase-like protein 2 n=1 Tax=Metopolophium dirhodum TaxID=44670 RepID=UPI00298F3FBB|nr:hydroxysteroid dehydrogenase-like protein 2 [Metopolophium dirhodum]XP_060864156.1 hydroxysteroid dehydrogenase-like protein 2 [Metopolophium dirhodum]XP_060864157.1 hydroxysteroid dehydrogenase-like protein 2 [Metopolophium dirhodum]